MWRHLLVPSHPSYSSLCPILLPNNNLESSTLHGTLSSLGGEERDVMDLIITTAASNIEHRASSGVVRVLGPVARTGMSSHPPPSMPRDPPPPACVLPSLALPCPFPLTLPLWPFFDSAVPSLTPSPSSPSRLLVSILPRRAKGGTCQPCKQRQEGPETLDVTEKLEPCPLESFSVLSWVST